MKIIQIETVETTSILLESTFKIFRKFQTPLPKFQEMCDGRSGHINLAKHWFELAKLEVCLLNPVQYCTGQRAPAIERVEIDKIVPSSVTGPAQWKWASPIAFSSKRGLASILDRMKRAKGRDCQGRLPHPSKWWEAGLVRRIAHIFDIRRQVCVFIIVIADEKRTSRPLNHITGCIKT